MEKKESFTCPHCEEKLPFRVILKVKKDHVFECPLCGGSVAQQKTKSFTSGYIIGFLSFALPQQVVFYLHQDNILAFLIGFLHAVTAFGLVSLYFYFNTKFSKAIALSCTPILLVILAKWVIGIF
jgi:biotin transporter BioY